MKTGEMTVPPRSWIEKHWAPPLDTPCDPDAPLKAIATAAAYFGARARNPDVPLMARAPSLDTPRDPDAPLKAIAAAAAYFGARAPIPEVPLMARAPSLDTPCDPDAPLKAIAAAAAFLSEPPDYEDLYANWTAEDEEEERRQNLREEQYESMREALCFE
jgi:hypothetical protein